MSKGNKKRTNNTFLPTMEDFNEDLLGDLGDDPSLEAELMELMGSGNLPTKTKERNKKKDMKTVQIDSNLLNMDINEDSNDAEFDENDPELLAELNSFLNEDNIEHEQHQKSVPVNTKPAAESVDKLEQLKSLYETAIKQAVEINDSSKSSRCTRSLKKINELLEKARRGQPIDESEFPPPVFVSPNTNERLSNSTKMNNIGENSEKVDKVNKIIQKVDNVEKVPEKVDKPNTTPNRLEKNPGKINKTEPEPNRTVLNALIERQNQYKTAALHAKSDNNIELAKGLFIVIKQFGEVISSVKSGQATFDIEDMPPPPSEFKLSDLENAVEELPVPMTTEIPTGNVGDELQVRLSFYRDSAVRATSEGNDNKARRLGRVIAQYEEALGAWRRHDLKYPFQELPPPPGRPPLTVGNQNSAQVQPTNQSRPQVQPANQNRPHTQTVNQGRHQIQPDSQIKTAQSKLLLKRQAEFKAAALKAKKSGDLALAKDLLRKSMGFDKMIEASESGLPIDLSQLPSLPTEQDFNFELVCADECETPRDMLEQTGTPSEILHRLATVLGDQYRTCEKYANSVGKSGDIISQKRFQALANSVAKDLDSIRALITTCSGPESVPKFHYEYRAFSVTQSNPDLADTDMSVEVVRATDLALPAGYSEDQFDTYVVLELGFPTDAPQTFTTGTVRKSTNPQYAASNKFQVNLKSRVFQRFVRNKQLRADLFYRKGFLQKDKLYGSVALKLDRLDTACTVHEAYDIIENRRVVAGKLELKVRVRSPLSNEHQSATVKEKWLVIDTVITSGAGNGQDPIGSVQPAGGSDRIGPISIDVTRYEVTELRRRLSTMNTTIAANLTESIGKIIADKEAVIRSLETQLKTGRKSDYLKSISALPAIYNEEAKSCLRDSKRDKAQVAVTKKKIVEKEIETLKRKP